MSGTIVQPANTPYSALVGYDGTNYRTVVVDSSGYLSVNSTNFSPVGMYITSDMDTAADSKYYGYVNTSGAWYIMKEVTTAGSFRFTVGSSGYITAWTNRTTQTYTYFDLVF
jgi:hypothetical protein